MTAPALMAGVLLVPGHAQAACGLSAQVPYKSGSLIVSTATKAGCSTSSTVTTTMRKSDALRDSVVASNAATITNGSVTASKSYESGKYRTRGTTSNGSFAESAWKSL